MKTLSEDERRNFVTTSYEEFDGDYIDADYGKLLEDIQVQNALNIGAYLEICVSLDWDSNKIEVSCSNDAGNEWKQHYAFEIPEGWKFEKVREMFPGNVYLRTEEYVKPEQEEDEEGNEVE